MKYIIIGLILISALHSCDFGNDVNARKAKNYVQEINNCITQINRETIMQQKLIKESLNKVDKLTTKEEVAKLMSIQQNGKKRLDAIAVPAIPRAEDVKTGCINLLAWELKESEVLIAFTNAKSEKERVKLLDSVEQLSALKQAAKAQMNVMFRDFAEKNGAEVSPY